MVDPFPVRADGTRFTAPTQNALGIMARAGRGYTYTNYDQDHARPQRWRLGMQRQLGNNWVIDAGYGGSFSDRVGMSHKLDILPEQFWADGKVRANAILSNLNSNVTNPFRLTNFASLQQSSALLYNDMSQNAFFTNATIRKANLLRAFPQMANALTNGQESAGKARTHEFLLNVSKRFSSGFNLSFGYTALKVEQADFYFYEWDAAPTWRTSNNGRPHRFVATGVYEWPFGRGKRFAGNAGRALNLLIGGWQTAATYEFQPGGLVDWGNVFYSGSDIGAITNVDKTGDKWFNTDNFERNAANVPNEYNRRVFPTRVPDLRADKTSLWNGNMSKSLRFTERLSMQLRFDALNIQNRSQMQGPNSDPTSTNFGRITSQTAATNRWLQIQARITF